MKSSVFSCALWLSVCAVSGLGCASGETPPPKSAQQAAPAVEACASLARKLCEELGPSSESCRATLGVIALLPAKACAAGLDGFDEAKARVAELRGACDELAQAVCAEIGEDSESCSALRADMPDIPPGHCPMLLRDRDQIVAALRAREASDEPLSPAQWQALTAAPAPSLGAADAKVTVVAFSDFECPYCAESARTLKRLKEAHGATVRLVFHHYPLPFHERAKPAAQAAVAAHAQNKFWDYHDLLFANQKALSAEALEAYAQQLKLDLARFRASSSDAATLAAIDADKQLGDSVQVRGTPTVFVNGKRLENGVDYDAVNAAVQEALGQ
jgi:protein-disulfide isomerase